MLLAPIALGMWIRARRPDWADWLGPRLQRFGMAAIVITVAVGFALAEEEQVQVSASATALVAAAVWTLSAMAIGWTTARLLGLNAADRFTFLIEFSARNIAVSAIVAMSGLGRLDLTFFSAAYMTVGYPLAVGASLLRRRRTRGDT